MCSVIAGRRGPWRRRRRPPDERVDVGVASERIVSLPTVCLIPEAGGFGVDFTPHRCRSILEVHGGLVTGGVGSMPTVEATE